MSWEERTGVLHITQLRCVIFTVCELDTGSRTTPIVEVPSTILEEAEATGSEKWQYLSWPAVWWRPVYYCWRQSLQPEWGMLLRSQVSNAKLRPDTDSRPCPRSQGSRSGGEQHVWCLPWLMKLSIRNCDRHPLYTHHLIHLSVIPRYSRRRRYV